jgi:hypothetical protein
MWRLRLRKTERMFPSARQGGSALRLLPWSCFGIPYPLWRRGCHWRPAGFPAMPEYEVNILHLRFQVPGTNKTPNRQTCTNLSRKAVGKTRLQIVPLNKIASLASFEKAIDDGTEIQVDLKAVQCRISGHQCVFDLRLGPMIPKSHMLDALRPTAQAIGPHLSGFKRPPAVAATCFLDRHTLPVCTQRYTNIGRENHDQPDHVFHRITNRLPRVLTRHNSHILVQTTNTNLTLRRDARLNRNLKNGHARHIGYSAICPDSSRHEVETAGCASPQGPAPDTTGPYPSYWPVPNQTDAIQG